MRAMAMRLVKMAERYIHEDRVEFSLVYLGRANRYLQKAIQLCTNDEDRRDLQMNIEACIAMSTDTRTRLTMLQRLNRGLADSEDADALLLSGDSERANAKEAAKLYSESIVHLAEAQRINAELDHDESFCQRMTALINATRKKIKQLNQI